VHQSFPSDFFIDRYQIERMYKSPSLQKNVTLVSLWTSDSSLDLEKSQLRSHAFETILTFQLSSQAMSAPILTLTLPFHLRYPHLGSEPYTEALLDEAFLFYDDHSTPHSSSQVLSHTLHAKGGKRKQAKVDHIPVGQSADMQMVNWILFSVIWFASLYLTFKVYYYQLKYKGNNKITHAS